jgi:molybdenum cofactor biosynthesis enzyme MoaA/aspartate/methionine/tyrosine aminotransferase
MKFQIISLLVSLFALPCLAGNDIPERVKSTLQAEHCQAALAGLDSADFRGYLRIKDEVGQWKAFGELDNRNLAGSLHHLIEAPARFPVFKTTAELVAPLTDVFTIPENLKSSLVFGRGVRHLLLEALQFYAKKNYVALLPEDIYPVYAVEAAEAHIAAINFTSIPELKIGPNLKKNPEVMVITSPLSPSGRSLTNVEVKALQTWLKADQRRRLILDSVYTFGRQWDASTLDLLENSQVIAIHSFAKAWLIPGFLGFAVGNKIDLDEMRKVAAGPNLRLASQALAISDAQPYLPAQVKAIIKDRWAVLTPLMRQIQPDWEPPTNGYLSAVPQAATTILNERGYWSMPLSAFGSQNANYSVVSALPDAEEELYYATTLSNLAAGYDKYSNEYSKAAIPQSSFPDKFFLLSLSELDIGIEKARAILNKTVDGDRVIVIKTSSRRSRLLPNERTGLGRYVPRNHIWIDQLYFVNNENDALEPVRLEDAMADSYALNKGQFVPFADIKPRSISILPIAMACQACCKFCFSEASASADVARARLGSEKIEQALISSKKAGAERVVITGGGEPTLIGFDKINDIIRQSARYFPQKITMITNGLLLAKLSEEKILQRLIEMDQAGLGVLAVSRHHYDPKVNAEIMGVDTMTEKIAHVYSTNRDRLKNLKLRFICVLQKTGVKDEVEIGRYVEWAKSLGVTEINFKELYVSTDRESDYVNSPANIYSEQNRVYLRTVLNYATWAGWKKIAQLPWGAPIFEGYQDGVRMQIAAYTEPSVFWERTNGIARSWNLMADGKLLVSLESGDSEISLSSGE